MLELFRAFILIFIAEMGDKTQILAMSFATRFPVKKVLLGIFLGSLLNHGLAVLLGSYIAEFVPVNVMAIIAGVIFIGFALWTLKTEGDDEEAEEPKISYGPVVTVALAFFIGEFGDKTQLAVITLATDATYPAGILAGAVLGMIVTGAIGIIVGKKLGHKIPEKAIQLVAASVFMLFGLIKLYEALPAKYVTIPNVFIFLGVIAILVAAILKEKAKRA
ncbi:TMEM165/GDT1 family protein [Dethiobacter alkaliphilus]|uniref:TMEM165/GDT1 family protein n=1 Tax=Dethiobacter alkaliphilus TaxID=427926 RepID=UPI002227F333|nr:TMEM165/GDT1 family protein [Dethiobacter alkaliphilus]MCW3489213.1 TMEM165/GDT1 family protein [Dethiobacter alkaliphilus]